MEPGEIDIEEVIKKWQGHQPTAPGEQKSSEEPWYKQPVSEYANTTRRRRRVKQAIPDYVKDSHLWQKRFRVIPPVLKTDIQHYRISQCNKCLHQDVLKFHPPDSKDTLNSQTQSLFEYAAASKKTLLKWHGARYFKTILLAACYQSKDETLLKQINLKPQPVIVIHDECDLLSRLVLYLFYAVFAKSTPSMVIRDEEVTSPLLKYLMQKLGFVFVGSPGDEKPIQTVGETLVKLLRSNSHVILGLKDKDRKSDDIVSPSSAPDGTIFRDVLCELRKDEKLLKNILLLPVSLSIEKGDDNFCSKLSITSLLKYWFCFPKSSRGIAQFNVSRGVKLHSIVAVAAEMNPQETCIEEDNLIQRHIAFDLHETCALLPTHLVSFLLLYKHRASVRVNDLLVSLEWLVHELREMEKFLGFSGEIDDILHHALQLLQLDNIVEYNTETEVVLPRISDITCTEKLYENAKKVANVFMTKAIVAASIVACAGGSYELRQGSGYSVKCAGGKILQKAEYLGELLSFLFDYCCSLNKLSDAFVDSLEKFVTMDVLSTSNDNYESQTHQKLVHNVIQDSGWHDRDDDDEDETYASNEIESPVVYDVSVEDDVIEHLKFLQSCINPFVELIFIVIVQIREYGEGAEFTISKIYNDLMERYRDGLFLHGEVLQCDFITRVLDYLYEKEVVDENETESAFMVSEDFAPGKGELENLLIEIALFRQ